MIPGIEALKRVVDGDKEDNPGDGKEDARGNHLDGVEEGDEPAD